MKKAIVIMLMLSVAVLMISCSENSTSSSENFISSPERTISKSHGESHDGFWALNNLDSSIPEVSGAELKASPFEIANTKNHWESRDGAWAVKAEPMQVAKAALIDQNHRASLNKLQWESHDGSWALNRLDSSIPEISGDELKASPFEIAHTKHHWDSRDGAWAVKTDSIHVAKATVR